MAIFLTVVRHFTAPAVCLFAALGFCQLSRAETLSCQTLFEVMSQHEVSIGQGLQVTESEVREFVVALEKTAGPLATAKRLEIELTSDLRIIDSNVNPKSGLMKIGLRNNIEFDKNVKALLSHEYGHTIFYNNFKVVFEGVSRTLAEIESILASEEKKIKETPAYARATFEINRFYAERNRLDAIGDHEGSKKMGALAYSASVRRQIQLASIETKQRRLIQIFSAKRSYDELFADLFAALHFKDGQVIADAMEFPDDAPYYHVAEEKNLLGPVYRRQNSLGGRPRDFQSINNFKNWQSENGHQAKIENYTRFDPVRGALWKILRKLNIPESDNFKILNAFLIASSRHLEILESRRASLDSEANITNSNQEFLKLLVEELKNENLLNTRKSSKSFSSLPKKGSDDFQLLVESLKSQLDFTHSYAVIDLRKWLSTQVGSDWYQSLPNEMSSQISSGNILSKDRDGKIVVKPNSSEMQNGINVLTAWMRELIDGALQGQVPLASGFTNLRLASSSKNTDQKVEDWHVDGGHAPSVTISLIGPGTEVLGPAPSGYTKREYQSFRAEAWENLCSGCKPFIVPPGFALVFFNAGSPELGLGQPMIHRTPKNFDERLLFVMRY